MQETAKQDGRPWTRFVFNKDALLDEEGAAPDSSAIDGQGMAGLGAFDFRQHQSAKQDMTAKQGKLAEEAHEVEHHPLDYLYGVQKRRWQRFSLHCEPS